MLERIHDLQNVEVERRVRVDVGRGRVAGDGRINGAHAAAFLGLRLIVPPEKLASKRTLLRFGEAPAQ